MSVAFRSVGDARRWRDVYGKASHTGKYPKNAPRNSNENPKSRPRGKTRRNASWSVYNVVFGLLLTSTVITLVTLAIIYIPRIGDTQGDVVTIQNQINDLSVSIIVQDTNSTRKRNSGPEHVALPDGYEVYHTASCFYQDGKPLEINHLDNVDASDALPGNVLGLDETLNWVPLHSVSVANLSDVANVNLDMLAHGHVLKYHQEHLHWESGKVGLENVECMEIQKRVAGSCPAQHYIRLVHENGTVECGNTLPNDTIGTSTLKDGSVTQNKIDKASVQARVTGMCHPGEAITMIHSNGSVTCDSAQSLNSIGSSHVIDGSLTIFDMDETTVQQRVTGECPHLYHMVAINTDGTVVCDNVTFLEPEKITTMYLANTSVGTIQLKNGAVTASKIDSVTVQLRVTGTCPDGFGITHVNQDGTVTCSDTVAPNTIGPDQLQWKSVTGNHITDNALNITHMSASYKRDTAGGLATLGPDGHIPPNQLPSVFNVTACADIPCRDAITGQTTGDIVVVTDRGDGSPETYIWDGNTYIELQTTGTVLGSTDDLIEGSVNRYWTDARTSSNADVTANSAHRETTTGNPHQLALGDLDNTHVPAPSNGHVLQYNGSMWVAGGTSVTTARSLGSGQSIFAQQVTNDLQFYSVAPGSTKVNIDAPVANVIAIDVNEAQLNHDALANMESNEHINHADIILTGNNGIVISGNGDLTASRTLTFNASLPHLQDVTSALNPMEGDILEYANGIWDAVNKPGAINIGNGSGNIYKDAHNNTYHFRTLDDVGNGRVYITTTEDTILFDVNEGSVDHNALLHYDAQEHINHASVVLSGSGGITVSGNGDLTAPRTIEADHTVLQQRVSGTCDAGHAIRSITESGGVVCEVVEAGVEINDASTATNVAWSASKISAELATVDPRIASVGDLADVDTDTETPNIGDVLTWTGSKWEPAEPNTSGGGLNIFGTAYQYNEVETTASTSSTSWQQRLRMTTPLLLAGDYRIGWFYIFRTSTTSRDFRGRVQVDDLTTLMEVQSEQQDPGSDQRLDRSGFRTVTLGQGTHTIDFDYRSSSSGSTSYVYSCRLEIWRVG